MSVHDSPVETDAMVRPTQLSRAFAIRRKALAPTLIAPRHWPNPIVTYRTIALGLAIVLIGSHLHAESQLRSDAWIIGLGLLHLLTTQIATRWLPNQTDIVNAAAVSIDIAFCVFILTMSYGWQGPFWLYAISAVFWPSVRFSIRGAIASVLIFDAAVLVANFQRLQDTISDGFGGDLVARALMVMFVAGAIAFTARAMSKVQTMAIEAERHRIARDLHDGVGKTMGGISLEASSLAQWVERDPVEASRRARYVARISQRAANEVRDVIRGLRQTEATAHLMPAVRAAIDDWSSASGIPVQLKFNGQDTEVPVLIHGEILRVLGELLRNVSQHANAREVRVRLTLSTAGVTLSVRDDGCGFDPAALEPWSGDGHFGLLGTRERISMLGGYCRLTSAPGAGTDVTVDIPLATRPERAFWVPDVFRMSERL